MGGVGSGAKPRQYPSEVVELVRRLYVDEGLTIAEIQRQVAGVKVQNLIARCGIPTRRSIPRDQTGPANPMWKGDHATYQALHLRVEAARGKPSKCEICEATDLPCEWANLTGNYTDVWDFARMCRSCHRRYDTARRKETGRPTVPAELRARGGAND